MRITSLHLQHVKRHDDLTLEFSPGMTVIRGPNESGKSTVQRAIEMVLFRRPTSTALELDGVRSWGTETGDPTVELSFDEEGQPGRLAKTFAGPRGSVTLDYDGSTETDPARVDQIIGELTGLPTEKFFRSTAGVRHQELDKLENDAGTLRDRLQLSMSGADRGTWTARKRLEEIAKRYRSEGPKNPGPLRVTRDEIERLTADLARGETELERLEQDRSAFAVAHDNRVALDIQIAEQRRQFEEAERAVELKTRQDDAQLRYERYRRAADLRDQIAAREAAHPSHTPLAVLKAGVDRLRNLEYDIVELKVGQDAEPDASSYQAIAGLPTWKPFLLVAVVLAVAAAVAFVVPGGVVGIGVAAVLLLAAAGTAFLTWQRLRLAKAARLQNEMMETQISRRLRGRSEREDSLRKTEREHSALLSTIGLTDLHGAELMLEAETEHVASIDKLKAELLGLLGADQVGDDVAALRDQAAGEADQARHVLSAMGDIGKDPEGSRGRLTSAVKTTQGQRENALAEEGQARGRVDKNEIDAEQVGAVAEHLTAAREHLAALERRLRIYDATLAGINAAEETTMKKAARFLEKSMGQDVALITDGRYRRIRVDEHNLAFSVYSAERGDWTDAHDLSQGTIDQLYLAARLGLVRQVTQDRRPPLIFDDPFVSFDDGRAQHALDLLKTLAADHQVIYLTCSDRYDSVADKVITLPGPDMKDVPGERDADEAVTAGRAGGVRGKGGASSALDRRSSAAEDESVVTAAASVGQAAEPA
jgi:DNA repair exonuclease SbcCD ATPase subunit